MLIPGHVVLIIAALAFFAGAVVGVLVLSREK